MLQISYFLLALSIFLAIPAPIFLAKAKWTQRAPFFAIILWQSIGLSGGISLIGAFLVYGLSKLDSNTNLTIKQILNTKNLENYNINFWSIFTISTAILITIHLLLSLLTNYLKVTKQRKTHRNKLNIISSKHKNIPKTIIIKHETPIAYCLPGGSKSITVLSQGLLNLLNTNEINAVIKHEQAHLRQKHHLLLLAFAAWNTAFPWLITTKIAQNCVNNIIEMLADDEALKTTQKTDLIQAISIVSTNSTHPPLSKKTQINTLKNNLINSAAQENKNIKQRINRIKHTNKKINKTQKTLIIVCSYILITTPIYLILGTHLFHK